MSVCVDTAIPYRVVKMYVLHSDREGGEIHFLLSSIHIRVYGVCHSIQANTKNLFKQCSCSGVYVCGLCVLWFSEFTLRKINIYSVNVEIN